MSEPSNLNLWAMQWRAERIRKARADLHEREVAYESLRDQTTDYALSIRLVRDTCAQVLAVWEASPTDLRCQYCDDTGDVHTPTGEWRGRCTCPAGKT